MVVAMSTGSMIDPELRPDALPNSIRELMKFQQSADRYKTRGSYTFSISKTVSNFSIKLGSHNYNWYWSAGRYNLDKIPWRRIVWYCKIRPYFCWWKGHQFMDVVGQYERCRWCDKRGKYKSW